MDSIRLSAIAPALLNYTPSMELCTASRWGMQSRTMHERRNGGCAENHYPKTERLVPTTGWFFRVLRGQTAVFRINCRHAILSISISCKRISIAVQINDIEMSRLM